MNYHSITEDDISNGDGVRIVLWVSGCTHNCKGCHNKETHSFKSGSEFTQVEEDKILRLLEKPYYTGLTLSGGDPLHPDNASDLENLVTKFKLRFPNKNLWIWTGYTLEELTSREHKPTKVILEYTDVLIDGKFQLENAKLAPKYRGSSNQRLIHLKTGKIE